MYSSEYLFREFDFNISSSSVQCPTLSTSLGFSTQVLISQLPNININVSSITEVKNNAIFKKTIQKLSNHRAQNHPIKDVADGAARGALLVGASSPYTRFWVRSPVRAHK